MPKQYLKPEILLVIMQEIDLAILDVMMPTPGDWEDYETWGGRRTGVVLGRWIKANYPRLRFLGLSAEFAPPVIHFFNTQGVGFISKGTTGPSQLAKRVLDILMKKRPIETTTIFIVHGHDELAKYQLKNFLQSGLGFPEPIILHEQPGAGSILIEKFEREASYADLVFVLLTPDDEPADETASNLKKRRARQNVIFEMGYFLGRLGRKKGQVILLKKGNIELPSDIRGLIYIDISDGIEAAGEEIRRELRGFL